MSDAEARVGAVNLAALAAAYDEADRIGSPVKYILVTVVLEDGTAGTGIPETTGRLNALKMTCALLGQLSEDAGHPVIVMPAPTTGRSQG